MIGELENCVKEGSTDTYPSAAPALTVELGVTEPFPYSDPNTNTFTPVVAKAAVVVAL